MVKKLPKRKEGPWERWQGKQRACKRIEKIAAHVWIWEIEEDFGSQEGSPRRVEGIEEGTVGEVSDQWRKSIKIKVVAQ